ncbi:MAG: hypothetical protein EPO00_00070 [Chloroflexota bacterium]|nr:MAG: hypothetical protein EPO00_00070 [Chloroflexota bacterium]
MRSTAVLLLWAMVAWTATSFGSFMFHTVDVGAVVGALVLIAGATRIRSARRVGRVPEYDAALSTLDG